MDDRFYAALIEIRRLCVVGTEAHGDEFYGPILNEVDKIEEAEGIDTRSNDLSVTPALLADMDALAAQHDKGAP